MLDYPRLGSYHEGFCGMRKTCQECHKPNRKCQEIQVNWFRGDDEVINICRGCKGKKTAEELLSLISKGTQDANKR